MDNIVLNADIRLISRKTAARQKVLIRGASLRIPAGGVCTIIGKNGSGKSTLIQALTGLLDKHQYSVEGSVIFLGRDLLKTSSSELAEVRRQYVRYVFQDCVNSFDPLRKLGYYLKPPFGDKHIISQLLEYFMLPGYEALSGLYPYELSGGMAQRIAFILAAASKPRLLMLDEPTSALDSLMVNLFIHKLREISGSGGCSVLMVTQDMKLAARISQSIHTLKDGTLISGN